MNDLNENRVKVWRAPNNGKPQTATRKNPGKRKAISNGRREAEAGSIGKPSPGAWIPKMFRAKEKPKSRSSIWMAAERIQAQSIGVREAKSSGKKKFVDGAWISKIKRTEADSNEKTNGEEAAASVTNSAPDQKESFSKVRQVEAHSNEQVSGEKVEISANSSTLAIERGISKVERATTDSKVRKARSGSKDTMVGNAADVKTVREGWVSPDYNTSKKVKLDYQAAARNRCVCLFRDLPYVEHYKMLRTQIQQRCGQKGWNTIMVTSVHPQEGKTVTAINLSMVLAKEFEQTVLLVDADLRKQDVHKYMGYQTSNNLVDYLETDVALSEVIVWPGVEKLTVISGNKTVSDSTEILGSPRMSSLVEEMKGRYQKRYIIFDVPPVLDRADAMTFAPLVDAILLVVEPGRTDLKDILKTTELLPKEKIVGFAMNRYMQ